MPSSAFVACGVCVCAANIDISASNACGANSFATLTACVCGVSVRALDFCCGHSSLV